MTQQHLELSEIWIYPIKSLGGVSLKTAEVQKKGLQYDRRWMLIDGDNMAMTQRIYPEMALFKPSIHQDRIEIFYRKSGRVIASTQFNVTTGTAGALITAQIWGDKVEVLEVDPEISLWFSDKLGTRCRLVAFPENNPRPVDPEYAIEKDNVSLADAFPFMVIGQASLDDLNQRLLRPVPMNRFRPNFVFTGGVPFLEDNWTNVSIGGLRFVAVKKCVRCMLPTVDQDSAEKSSEPLRTLSAYRNVHNKVLFGQNMIALGIGRVNVGDRIITL